MRAHDGERPEAGRVAGCATPAPGVDPIKYAVLQYARFGEPTGCCLCAFGLLQELPMGGGRSRRRGYFDDGGAAEPAGEAGQGGDDAGKGAAEEQDVDMAAGDAAGGGPAAGRGDAGQDAAGEEAAQQDGSGVGSGESPGRQAAGVQGSLPETIGERPHEAAAAAAAAAAVQREGPGHSEPGGSILPGLMRDVQRIAQSASQGGTGTHHQQQ